MDHKLKLSKLDNKVPLISLETINHITSLLHLTITIVVITATVNIWVVIIAIILIFSSRYNINSKCKHISISIQLNNNNSNLVAFNIESLLQMPSVEAKAKSVQDNLST